MKILNHLFILLLFCSLEGFAQTAEKQAHAKIKQLNTLGIDTVLIYKCSGGVFVDYSKADCKTSDYLYLIWADKNNNYIQRFDPCYQHEPVVNEMAGAVNLLRWHLARLIEEELKPRAGTTSLPLVLDDFYYVYTINLTGTEYIKQISWYFLHEKYYENTYLKQLNDLVGMRIDSLYKQLTAIKK